MIQVFKTDEQYVKWLNGQTLPSGIVVYVSDDETMYFSTNNIKGELKTYKCEKGEPIQPNNLVYSAKSAGSTITVNGETVTLEQGENITLDYPNEITSVSATDNKALTYIKIPNTMTSIGDRAFYNCTSLDSVTLSDSLTSIGQSAFRYCTSLVSVTLPYSLTSIGNFAFKDCSKLSSINIPESVKSIGNVAFQNCISLSSVTLPEGITTINNSTFNGCSSLVSVTLPYRLTSIGGHAFSDSNKLPSITIPSGVKSIDYSAFANCSALTDFNFNGTTSQWASITLGTDWNKDAAFTVVHCTDGDVTL